MVGFKTALKRNISKIENSTPYIRKLGDAGIGNDTPNNYGSKFINFLDRHKYGIAATAAITTGVALATTAYQNSLDKVFQSPDVAEGLRRGVMKTVEYAGQIYDKAVLGLTPHFNTIKDSMGNPVIYEPGPERALNFFENLAVGFHETNANIWLPTIPVLGYSAKVVFDEKKPKKQSK